MCQKDTSHYSSREIKGKDKNEQKINKICWNIQYQKLPEIWICVLKIPCCSFRHTTYV
jgi:hypothetical protein